MLQAIARGATLRSQHTLKPGERPLSSRSHLVCEISERSIKSGRVYSKLNFIDLAGSEIPEDSKHAATKQRLEAAEINNSFLTLNECIRAAYKNQNSKENLHIPFRASKLSFVLRDFIISKSLETFIIMIGCVLPGAGSVGRSLDT
jgi:hypothetical protein